MGENSTAKIDMVPGMMLKYDVLGKGIMCKQKEACISLRTIIHSRETPGERYGG
jgi:hypothetical protein